MDSKKLDETISIFNHINNNNNKISTWNLLNLNKKARTYTAFQKGFCSELVMMEIYKRGLELLGDSNFFEKEKGIYYDFAYSVVETFNNYEFNMQRVKPIDFSDLKKEKGKDWKHMSKEEKKKYREDKKETTRKMKEIAVSRIEEFQRPGKEYFFVKLRNSIIGKGLNFYIPFSEYEVLVAQRCIYNGWDFPPVEYFETTFKEPTKGFKKAHDYSNATPNQSPRQLHSNAASNTNNNSINNSSKQATQKYSPKHYTKKVTFRDLLSPKKSQKSVGSLFKLGSKKFKSQPSNVNNAMQKKESREFAIPIQLDDTDEKDGFDFQDFEDYNPELRNILSNINWTKDLYQQIISCPSDYYDNEKPILDRGKGSWVSQTEFSNLFNTYIIYHNPKYYLSCLNVDMNWYDYNNDICDLNFNSCVIHLTHRNKTENPGNTKIDNEKPALLVIFEFNTSSSSEWDDLNNYITLDLVDKNGYAMFKDKLLSKSFNTFQVDELVDTEEYFIKLKNGFTPFGYNFTVYSDNNLEKISYNHYLNAYFNYKSHSFKNDHGVIKAKNFYSFDKLMIKVSNITVLINIIYLIIIYNLFILER